MTKKLSLLFISCLALLSVRVSAQTELEIEGLEGSLLSNVEAYISAIPEEEYSTSLRFQSRLEKNARDALKALGYYDPSMNFSIEGQEDEHTLVFTVNAGEPVYIYVSDITITGEAKTDIDFINAVDNSGLNLGQVIDHGKYESLKSRLQNLALRKGYFDGEFTLSRLEIAPGRHQALVRLHYQSGQRYHFGETKIEGSQIEEQRVRSIIPFKEGDSYLASQIGELNQSLSNTEWFSSVYVEPDLEAVGSSRQLPMNVHLSPQVRNQLETSIGYSTDVGVRGKIRWKKPWLNEYGHSLDAGLSISKPEQEATVSYKIPLEQVLKDYYIVKYGLKNVDNRDTDSLESNLAFERHWVFDSGWHRTIYTRFLYEEFTQGIQDGTAWLVLPGVSFSKSRSRGGTMPMWGDKKSFSIEATDQALTSDAKLLRLLAQGAIVRSIGENHRGVARGEIGAMYTDNFYKLPPSIRFFAGGDNSVRGYGYEEISPKDKNGYLTGGQFMATTSLEYQYRVVGNWWVATFVDYGDAWISTPDWKMGAGLGIRWASPVGPVRLDFAWGFDADPGDEFKVHFTLGPEV
ncbi:outer membrane protein assembly factor [Aliivibrio finisterrensis]|uniref:autotransporter assembly complex protein TamA n=1 Tax=Aliivibrio finisterrensis TaxID=511998 RepID=UPI00102094CE|nr:autotransporter assembly complex family protein [Aliivibrio finisterrensis]RYU66027.1 outer membrane protein assembly factor [Aliivibrio finisterrensis]RYU69368.1 outer membrane protein assembly factor [Aliivibrio finisterrensis]RYU73080.1 outer membrane protein assembly factor [Aliivibrio finisterrensis]